ncbi:MAG: chorismate mutase [Bacteroidetes bacterium]|nr:chorismate mutase [Bacteroidota bacterium]
MSLDEMDKLRQQIDALDRQLVDMLNDRAKLANKIGEVKKTLALPVYNPKRETEVMQNVMNHSKGPMEPAAIKRLFERIIDETRRLEREHMEKSGDHPA